jgi:hypothetical protein
MVSCQGLRWPLSEDVAQKRRKRPREQDVEGGKQTRLNFAGICLWRSRSRLRQVRSCSPPYRCQGSCLVDWYHPTAACGLRDDMHALSNVVGAQRAISGLRLCRQRLSVTHAQPLASGQARNREYSLKAELQDVDLSRRPAEGAGKLCRNRSVLLTGGTSGIGYAVADRLIKEGAGRILIPTRDAVRGKDTVERLKISTGFKEVPVSTFTMDIRQPSSRLMDVLKQMVSQPTMSTAL